MMLRTLSIVDLCVCVCVDMCVWCVCVCAQSVWRVCVCVWRDCVLQNETEEAA